MSIIPLDVHYYDKGMAKVTLGVAKGKKLRDKRETEKERDWSRAKGRLLRDRGKAPPFAPPFAGRRWPRSGLMRGSAEGRMLATLR